MRNLRGTPIKCNQAVSGVRRTKICLLLAVALTSAGLGITSFAAHERNGLWKSLPQRSHKINLTVRDGRPVAKAITVLEARYGWVITYEDPRYSYSGDVDDVTESVRRDLHKYPAGRAPRVLVPKEGTLSFDYDVMNGTNLPVDPMSVVVQMLAAQANGANFKGFRMEKGHRIIHVIPTAIRDRSGRVTSQQSLLDAMVRLPEAERTGLQTLEALCAAISKATRFHVIAGAFPTGVFVWHKDKQAVKEQSARQALAEFLQRVSPDRRLSWQLFYDPGMRIYALNIHSV